ncbi:MAG: CoA pyrophosphatase [Roseovarius sp.]|nr:CoA pyrophosphatase [Roseovarius sp.]MCY4290559.1 CoA pyrophosphatase [Roseovarius sp.]
MKAEDQLSRILSACALFSGQTSDYDLSPDVVLSPNRELKSAGVLVPILNTKAGHVVFMTRRSLTLKQHPGQIAFPGGKKDAGDSDVIVTALREANEEIGIARSNVEVVGQLPKHETVTGFVITPVIGRIMEEFTPVAEAGEVEEVFSVPLSHVLNPLNYSIRSRLWRGRPRPYYTVPYGPYYIWGATARILHMMSEIANR